MLDWLRGKKTGQTGTFDQEKYGSKISWTKDSFLILNTPDIIRSGEFHYWRVPDRLRWRRILSEYKSAGLNCVRIYFHWGWHSPSEGKYIFSGNRDVDYLLNLCEEIGLWVLAAPGPYICAETSGGGFPTWLIQKTDVRIRHAYTRLTRKYDSQFTKYSCEWLQQIFAIFASHQITARDDGCIIAIQLENELFVQGIFSHDYELEPLVLCARSAGISVPLFHNDAKDLGSFAPGNGSHKMDMYSFDRYVEIPPVSLRGIKGTWSCSRIISEIKGTENRIRKFDQNGPIFIAEMQGGWFRGWTGEHSSDAVYDYFNGNFTSLILHLFAAEGATATNTYMFYGGTNWGTLGDPDVISSYDYAACIRENGFVSDRFRRCRLVYLFGQSWRKQLVATEALSAASDHFSAEVVFAVRKSKYDNSVFVVLANLSEQENANTFRLRFPNQAVPGLLPFSLPHKSSFVAVGHVSLNEKVKLQQSTIHLVGRGTIGGREVLVGAGLGALLLRGAWGGLRLATSAHKTLMDEDTLCHLEFREPGYARIQDSDGRNDVTFIILSTEDALTLNIDFEAPQTAGVLPKIVAAWGTYNIRFAKNEILVDMLGDKRQVFMISEHPYEGFSPISLSEIFSSSAQSQEDTAPIFFQRNFGVSPFPESSGNSDPVIFEWQNAVLNENWNNANWKRLEAPRVPHSQALPHGFTSGHVAYRCTFRVHDRDDVHLRVNVRHHARIWLNGHGLSSLITYNSTWKLIEYSVPLGVFQGILPIAGGNSCGADSEWLGSRDYNLADFAKNGENVLIILVDSFGMSRQAIFNNDIRYPRGVLSAEISGDIGDDQVWEICGTNVLLHDDVFNISGLPLEDYYAQKNESSTSVAKPYRPCQIPTSIRSQDGLTWWTGKFTAVSSIPPFEDDSTVERSLEPLQVVINGSFSACVWINKLMIARYHGDLGPQHYFPIPDGILNRSPGSINEITIGAYTTELSSVSILVLRCRVNPQSGNQDDRGVPILIETVRVRS